MISYWWYFWQVLSCYPNRHRILFCTDTSQGNLNYISLNRPLAKANHGRSRFRREEWIFCLVLPIGIFGYLVYAILLDRNSVKNLRFRGCMFAFVGWMFDDRVRIELLSVNFFFLFGIILFTKFIFIYFLTLFSQLKDSLQSCLTYRYSLLFLNGVSV